MIMDAAMIANAFPLMPQNHPAATAAFSFDLNLIGDSSECNFLDNRWLWPNLSRSRRHRTVSGGVKIRCRSVNAA
jgi:argininosuccinate synthase